MKNYFENHYEEESIFDDSFDDSLEALSDDLLSLERDREELKKELILSL